MLMHHLTAASLLLMLAPLSTHSNACTRMSFNAYLLSRTDSAESLISQIRHKENLAIQPTGSVEMTIDITGTLHTAQLKAIKAALSSETGTQLATDGHSWQGRLWEAGMNIVDTVIEQLKPLTPDSPAVLEVTQESAPETGKTPTHPASGNLLAFFQHAPEDAIWMQQETERATPTQIKLLSKTITLNLPTGESFQRSYTPDLSNEQSHNRAVPEPTLPSGSFILIHPALQQGGSQPLAVGLNLKTNTKGVAKTETPETKTTVIGLPSLFTQSRETPPPDFFTPCWFPELLSISSNTAVNCLLSFNNHNRVPAIPETQKIVTVQPVSQTDSVTFVSIDNRTWKYIIWESLYGTKLLLEQLECDDTAFSEAPPCTTDKGDAILDDLDDAMKDAD